MVERRTVRGAVLTILILLVGLPGSARAQDFPPWLWTAIGVDTARAWAPVADWAVTDSASRAAVLEALAPEGPWTRDPPIDGSEWPLRKLDDWPDQVMVVDFSGDEVPDVVLWSERWDIVRRREGRLIFTNSGTGSAGWFRLYQWIDGEFVDVTPDGRWKSLFRLYQASPWRPAALLVRFHECTPCTGTSFSHYEPFFRGDTLDFRRAVDVLPMPPGNDAEEVFGAPRPFVVENEVYSLRARPELGPVPDWPSQPGTWFQSPALAGLEGPWEFDGNRFAVYEQGARGVALASATDDTGRVWWYVLMSPHTPPVEPVFQTPVSLGGWMSSRFLREVGRVANTPPGRDPPPELPEPR